MPTPRTLLVADDSPTVRKVVTLTFDDEGFRVVAAASGAEALAEIGREVPDIILADVHMPAPAGYELCARVRAEERTRRVPVVLLVGAFEPFDEAEARSCGADGVLTKPFQSIRDLVNKVGGLLGGHQEPPRADDATALGLRRDERAAEEAGADSTARTQTAAHADASGDEAFVAADEHDAAQAHEAARAYSDFDTDDADIESVPAAEFEARQPVPDEATAAAAADLFAAGYAAEEEFAFADAAASPEVESEAEAEPYVSVSQEPPADAGQSGAPPQPQAAESGDSSMSVQGEQQVSQPNESFASPSHESFLTAPDQSSVSAQAASSPSEQQTSAASESEGARAQSFDARAAAAAEADDTLLELGDIDSPPSRADVAEDDFVLDFDEEPRPFAPQSLHAYPGASFGGASYSSPDSSSYAEHSAGAAAYQPPPAAYQQPSYDEQSYAEPSQAEPSYDEPVLFEDAPSAVEMQSAGSVSMAEPEPSAVWDAAQEFTVSPDAVTAPVTAPAWEEPEARETTLDSVDVQTVSDAGDTQAAHEEATTGAARGDAATGFARESEAQPTSQEAQPASQSGAHLSHEAVEAIARRVVELMSDRAVREIAWEVVPDLAERLIRQKLEEERARQ